MTEAIFYPHDCERFFPICEEREEMCVVSRQMEKIRTYKNADGSIGVVEILQQVSPNKGQYQVDRQRLLYITDGRPNWKGFDDSGKLASHGVRRYKADGSVEDGVYLTQLSIEKSVVEMCPIVAGRSHGKAMMMLPGGTCMQRTYVDGIIQGDAIITDVNGNFGSLTYIDGQSQGLMKMYDKKGDILDLSVYIDGECVVDFIPPVKTAYTEQKQDIAAKAKPNKEVLFREALDQMIGANMDPATIASVADKMGIAA